MIENIIITGTEGELDFQAEGFEPVVVELFEDAISFINPFNESVTTRECEFHAGAAIIVTD